MTQPIWRKLLILLLIVATISSIVYAYWYIGWARIRSSGRDEVEYGVIQRIVQAINAYKAETGAYPDDLGTVLRDSPMPPTFAATGANRLEYLGPKQAREGLMLRSYGHKEDRRGWNLRYDDVIWEIRTDGSMVVKPVVTVVAPETVDGSKAEKKGKLDADAKPKETP